MTFGPSGLDKCHMALMQRPHRRDQADTLFGSSPRADPSSQIGNGPRNVQIVHLMPSPSRRSGRLGSTNRTLGIWRVLY